jgi:hypothetical protein
MSNQSVSLAQSIQARITKCTNQVTLGLAIKLHHRFGSKELISILHEHGYITTYDEVLRFRTSVAKCVGEQDYTARGLAKNGGTISAWCDNYDLNVFTPNGKRETHAMAVEFTQHPTFDAQEMEQGEVEVTEQIISRLSKGEMKETKLSELAPVNW